MRQLARVCSQTRLSRASACSCAFLPRLCNQHMLQKPGKPCRDYKADAKQWGWSRAPPVSQKQGGEPDTPKKLRKKVKQVCTCLPASQKCMHCRSMPIVVKLRSTALLNVFSIFACCSLRSSRVFGDQSACHVAPPECTASLFGMQGL